MHLKVYKHKSEYSRPPVFLSRVYNYLSLSRGEPLRPWQPEEKEKLIAEIESHHARKLAQYPHNKKAYDTDRKKALGGLKARNVILPRMAMVEGWPGDTLGAELHNATGAMMDIVREDLRILASRPKLDSESVKFSGIDDVGKRKSYKGQLVSSNVSHEVYRRSNGNTFIIPRERESAMKSVLFVCMGNICRSPTAEGVFRHFVAEAGLTDEVEVDSAGTHAYHKNEPADRRASAAAERRGYSLADIRARRVQDDDFERFDFIIAMDRDNLAMLIDQSDPAHHHKVSLFLQHASGRADEVPDPYYGGAAGFERVLDLVEEASRGLLETLKQS